MKKLLTFIFFIIISLSIIGCGETTDVPTTDNTSSTNINSTTDSTTSFNITITVDATSTTVNVLEGEKLPVQTNPVKEGYTFNGWYLDGNLYDFDTPVTSEFEIIASFSLNNYNINYYVDDVLVNTDNYDFGETINLYNYSSEGYTFNGWYIDDSYSSLNTEDVMPANDLNLYGYTVELNYYFIPTEDMTVTFWHSLSGDAEVALNNMIAEFELEYTNIDVIPVYKENIEADISNGYEIDVLPTMFLAEDYFIYQASTIPMLEELELIMTSNLGINISDITAEYYNQSLLINDGYRYSLPFVSDNEVILYNKDLFNDSSVTMPEDFTYDTLTALASTLVGSEANQCENLMYHSDATSLLLSIYKATNNMDTSFLGMKILADSNILVTDKVLTDPKTAFASGEVAMVTINASEIESYLALNPGFEIGVNEAGNPTTDNHSILTNLLSFGINDDLDEDEFVSAWLLAKFLTNPEQQAKFTSETYLSPVNNLAYDETIYTDLIAITDTSDSNYFKGQVLNVIKAEKDMLLNAPYQTPTIPYFNAALDEYLFGEKDFNIISKEVYAYIPELDPEFTSNEVTRFFWANQPVVIDGEFTLPEGFVVYDTDNRNYIDRGPEVTLPSSFIGDTLVRVEIRKTTDLYEIFCDFYIIVEASDPIPVNTNVEQVINDYVYFEPVNIMGYITNFADGGFYVSDGINAIFVEYSNDLYTPAIGDYIFAEGVYSKYGNQQYRISNVVYFELIEEGDGYNVLNAEVVELSDIETLDPNNHLYNGQRYTITGEIVVDHSSSWEYISIVSGENSLDFGIYMDEDYQNTLRNQETNIVTIEVYIADITSSGETILGFNGTYKDIVVVVNNHPNLDQEIDSLEASLPDVVSDDFTLPSFSEYGAAITNWTSSEPSVISNTGVVNPTNTTVTLTADVTLFDETKTMTKVIQVVTGDTIQTALLKNDNTVVSFTGVVYFKISNTVFIEENGYYITVNNADLANNTSIGDLVSVTGEVTSPMTKDMRIIYSLTYEVLSSNNTLPTPIAVTDNDLLNGNVMPGTPIVYQAKFVETSELYHEGYFEFVDGYTIDLHNPLHTDHGLGNYLYLFDAVYYNSEDGLIYDNNYSSLLYDDLSETEILDIIFNTIYINESVFHDNHLELPVGHKATTTYFAYTTPNPELIEAYSGYISPIKGEVSITTLDIQVTINEVSRTETYDIRIVDANAIDITEIINLSTLEEDSLVRITGVVTSFRSDGTIYIQDSLGNPLFIAEFIDSDYPDVQVGDEIEIIGTYYKNTINGTSVVSYVSYLEILSSNNDLFVDNSYSVEEITVYDYFQELLGRRLSQTFIILELEDMYGYTLLQGETYNLKFKWEGIIPIEDIYSVGDTLYIEFTYDRFYDGSIYMSDVIMQDYPIVIQFDYVESKIDIPTDVYGDLDLLTENQEMNATITWTSNNTSVVSNTGIVTPDANNDIVVTLTAEIKIGNVYRNVDYVITVKKEVTSYTNVLDLDTNELEGNTVAFEGNVLAILNGGYLLTDGVNSVFVNSDSIDLITNDYVKVVGLYANSVCPSIDTVYSEKVLIDGDGVFPVTATEVTMAYISSITNEDFLFGYVYTIDGYLSYTNGVNVYINGFNGDNGTIEISSLSPEASYEFLKVKQSGFITLDVIFAYNDGTVKAYFIGDESDISNPFA